MKDIASRYLDMLQRGFVMAGSADTPFKKCNLDIDRVRYYKYKERDEKTGEKIGEVLPLPDCIKHPEDEKHRRELLSDIASEWYDARFFQLVVRQMNELILFDRELTLDETRREYWELKTNQKMKK